MTEYIIQIPNWRPATLNSLMNVHWGKVKKLKDADKAMVATYGRNIPKATGKRRVTFSILTPKGMRKVDPDSILKSGLDALVCCGLLVDDSDKYVEVMPVTQGRPEVAWRGTLIRLEDI